MKGILKRLATLTIMAALVLCLLPMMSMTAFAESNSATYTDGVYVLEVTNYDEYMQTGTHVRSIELLGIENVDISINTSNQIVCSFKLRFIDAIEQECTTDYSFSFTVENKSCTEAISHSFEATYGKGSSATYVVTKGTLTRAARTEHTGDATCIAKAKCSVCGEEYGAVNPDAHIWGDWTYSNGKHSRTCTLNGTHKESANCTRGENDRCTVCETNLVASLTSGDTTTYYNTVDEAFAAAQAAGSGTVTVLANAEYTREKSGAILYSENISLVVNPNVTLTTKAFLRLYGSISGGGTIAGTNQGWLIAYDGSTIEGITATAGLNIAGGTILSGTFAGEVQSDGTIKGGTFSGMVYNSGTIEGGTFSETVVNHDYDSYYSERGAGTISGGTFNCTVENTPGTINGGTFNGQLTNKPYGEPYSEYEPYVEATVDADKLTLGENFSFTNQGGTVNCTTHKRRLPATCKEGAKCIFCGNIEGDPDPTAHSLSYSAADNVITETCAHGCAAPATATLEINTGSVVYTGEEQKVPATVAHTETWRGSELIAQYKNNTDVGTATVYIQAGEAKAVKTFEITKAAPTLEHFDITLPQNAVYDGDQKPATVKLKDGYTGAGEIQIKYYQGENDLGSAPTDAGTYTVKFSVADGTNFNAMELTEAGSFTIAKAETVNIAPVAIQNLVYDGSELALITAGEVTGAAQAAGYKMMYMLEEEGAVYTDTIPVATDAGTYIIIWCAGYDNDNFIMNSGTMEVTIAKADIDYTAPTARTLTYNTKPQELITAGVGALQYKLGDGEWYDAVPTATNAGDYTVYYRTNMGDNYNNVPETPISAKIAPFNFATAEGSQVGLVENSFVYDGTAKTGNISSKVKFQTSDPYLLEKTLTKDTDFTVAYANNVKAGTATATFTGKGNYTGVITDTFEITKAPLTLTVEDQTITYGEEIDQSKYSVTGLAIGDTATVTLTPSTTNITKSGSITAEITIKNAAGEDVTACYTVATSAAGLVIDPDLSPIKDLTVENVHYSSESAIKGLQDALNDATEDTATQDAIKDAKVKCAQLLTQINESLDALKTDEINATLSTTASNVKLTDKANVTKAIADIKAAKEKFDGNYSDEDIETLDKQIAQLEATLKAIGNAEAVIADLNAMPADVEPDDDAAIKAKAAYEKLTSNERSMVNSVAAAKVAALTNYKIVKGDKGTWKNGTLTFTINGDHDRFTGVQVNGKAISKSYYSSKSGSTIVTLKESYIKTISSQATHKITFLFNDGTVEGTFYIHKDAMTPATGDEANIVLYSAVFAVSLAALVALFLVSKKRKQKNS